MARFYWKGADGTARLPDDGRFDVGSNWLGGAAPTEAGDAFLAAGAYTVTVFDGADEVRSITIGAGVTVSVTGPSSSYNVLYVNAQSVNYGTLDLRGGVFWSFASDPLINYGAIQGVRLGSFGGVLQGGPIENLGFIGTGVDTGQLASNVAIHNLAGAEIGARTGTVYLGGVLTNEGLVGAYGQLVTFADPQLRGSSANFADSHLRGGAWEMLAGGAITLNAGGRIVDLLDGADVTLGAGTTFSARQDDDTVATIEDSLRVIGSGAALHLVEERSFEASGVLSVKGVLTLDGGTISADAVMVEKGALLAGSGTIAAETDVRGHVIVRAEPGIEPRLELAGDTDFSGLATGRGTLSFTGGQSNIDERARIRVGGLAVSDTDLRLDAALNFGGALTLERARLDIHTDHLRLGKLAHVSASEILGAPGSVLTLKHGADFTGDSSVDVLVSAKGRIEVGGTADFNRAVSGTGNFVLGDDAGLDFAAGVTGGSKVTMSGDGAELSIGDPDAFHAHILRFGGGDRIALAGIDAGSRLAWRADEDGVGGTLSIFDADGRVALRFDDGRFNPNGFHLDAEAGGVSALTYRAPGGGGSGEPLEAASFHAVEALLPVHMHLV